MTRPETGGTKNRNQLSYLTSKRMVVLANAACDHKGSLGKKNKPIGSMYCMVCLYLKMYHKYPHMG